MELVGDLQAVILDLLELGDVVDIGVRQFVDLRGLDILEAFGSLEEPKVEQVTSNHFETIELRIGGDSIFGILSVNFGSVLSVAVDLFNLSDNGLNR